MEKKLIVGRSKSFNSEEWLSTRVSVTHIKGDPSDRPLSETECLELKIGIGKRSSIVQLPPEKAYQLVYELISIARAVEVRIAEDKAYQRGIQRGQK
jgi:hypothetical protein